MKKNNIFFIALTLFALIFNYGCKEKQLSPIRGSLKCYVDESLYNIVQTARDSFVVHYKESKIDLVTVKAREGIAAILNDSAHIFISSRDLNAEEKAFLAKKKSEIRSFKFCYDAVVPIVQENDQKEKITLEEIKNILSGKVQGINVFVPEHNSGVYEYLKTKVLENKEPQNVSIVKSEEETINRVKANKKSLGFVGLNSLENVKGVKMLEVGSKPRSDGEALYYKPYVAYLTTQTYPLVRTTTIFINDYGIGLPAGFSTYLTSYEGQKLISQHNLGPATVPVKMVY